MKLYKWKGENKAYEAVYSWKFAVNSMNLRHVECVVLGLHPQQSFYIWAVLYRTYCDNLGNQLGIYDELDH